jgi:hypothetical protein
MQIIANKFVKRQTPESRFSHYAGTWDELTQSVWWQWHTHRTGYREGVALVTVEPDRFYSGVVCLAPGDELTGGYESPGAKHTTPE